MSERGARLARKALDGLQYALVGTGLAVGAGGAVSLLATGDLRALKWLLFLGGLLVLAAGAVKLRPAPVWRDEPRRAFANGYTDSGYGAAVGDLPPASRFVTQRTDRLSDGGRLFLLGVVALATSFALEGVLGVGVPRVP